MITVTGSAKDILGVAAAASVQFRLCGYGTALPVVAGTGIIVTVFPPPVALTAGSFSVSLYGNDAIQPVGTFYTVQFLDAYGVPLQTASYQFIGSGPIDISTLTPYNASAGSPLNGLIQPFYYSANATLPNTAHPVVAFGTGGSYGIALKLPLASLALMAPITIKKVDAGVGPVFVACQGSDKVDNDTSYELVNQHQYITVLPGVGGWFIVANN